VEEAAIRMRKIIITSPEHFFKKYFPFLQTCVKSIHEKILLAYLKYD
jgi:hypothetical protein